MAFKGKDWRDPGGEYVKSHMGYWESKRVCRLRIFEMLNESFLKRAFHQYISEFEIKHSRVNQNMYDIFQEVPSSSGFYQPHIIVKQISTKESAIVTSLSETLVALDFKVAIRDIRRFGYVFRVLQIFVTKFFSNLSGRTQLYIIELLREILAQVIVTKNNTNLLRQLLDDLQITLENGKYNHLGSFQLWENHLKVLNEMKLTFQNMEIGEEKEMVSLKFQNLPIECIMKIIQNLTCPQDLQMLGQTCFELQSLVNDDFLWKKLVACHFTESQISTVLAKSQLSSCSWCFIYTRLLRQFGDRHYFPIKLAKCVICSSIFWPIYGHPCSSASIIASNFIFLSPEEFVNLFPI